jgi:hypothetical protein
MKKTLFLFLVYAAIALMTKPATSAEALSTTKIVVTIENPVTLHTDHQEFTNPFSTAQSGGDAPDAELITRKLDTFISIHKKKLFSRVGESLNHRIRPQLIRVSRRKKSTVYEFQQTALISLGGQSKRYLPLHGSSIQLEIPNSQSLNHTSVLLTLRVFPQVQLQKLDLRHFAVKLSEGELARLIQFFKISDSNLAKLHLLLEPQSPFTVFKSQFSSFLNSSLGDQRERLNRYLSRLGPTVVLKTFDDASQVNNLMLRWNFLRLSWDYELKYFLNLPLTLRVSQGENGALDFLDLQEPFDSMNLVRSWDNPVIPPILEPADTSPFQESLSATFKKIQEYFEDLGFKSLHKEEFLDILTNVKGARFRENAFWNKKIGKFIIGAGGEQIAHLAESVGVLGHEYTHFVIDQTSRLSYEGESGALNEHFADLMGAGLEAELLNGARFDHALDGRVLTPLALAKRTQLLKLSLKANSPGSEDQMRFNLATPRLRNFFAPRLSFATQFETLEAGLNYYGVTCTPSLDNDNCGVHSLSGIPNRAATLIIDKLGFSQTKEWFYQVLAERLSSQANFLDYRNELYGVCRESLPPEQIDCEVIKASFALVGVTDGYQILKNENRKKAESNSSVQALLSNQPVHRLQLETDSLRFCGWFDTTDPSHLRVIDGKFDVALSMNESLFPTMKMLDALGKPLSPLEFRNEMKKHNCGCIKARIINRTLDPENKSSRLENLVSQIEGIIGKADSICAGSADLNEARDRWEKEREFKDFLKRRSQAAQIYCGWVSVNSRSRNITIIDNQFDAAILQSRYPPSSLTRSLSKSAEARLVGSQCSCVRGTIAQLENAKGTLFNYFVALADNNADGGILRRKDSDCFGLEWR